MYLKISIHIERERDLERENRERDIEREKEERERVKKPAATVPQHPLSSQSGEDSRAQVEDVPC